MSPAPRQPRVGRHEAAAFGSDLASGGSAEVIITRMLKLAAARSTGILRVSGDAEGAIHFSQGQVVFARSERTPGPLEPAGAVGQRAAGDHGPGGQLSQLISILTVVQPTVDAVVDLLSGASACRRFRTTGLSPSAPACSIAVGDLLAEVTRQQRQLGQMSAFITPDTTVWRTPRLARTRVQVSGLQWALLIRVRRGATPRELARELDRTVFGTTVDVYGLIVLGLLRTEPDRGGEAPYQAARPT